MIGWLLIIGMIGLFVSIDMILFYIIKEKKQFSLKYIILFSSLAFFMIYWTFIMSITCFTLLTISHMGPMYDTVTTGFSFVEILYSFLLYAIPIVETIIVFIGILKYITMLKMNWKYSLMPIGISGVVFCIIFLILTFKI